MGIHARIEPGGYVSIDTAAWLEQRTGGPIDEATADLLHWAETHPAAGAEGWILASIPRSRGWILTARAWCTQQGWELVEPDLIVHTDTRLDAEIWILRASTPTADFGRIAIVGVDHDPPVVFAESCTDSGDWFLADTVDVFCPDGHGWTWRTGDELIDATGSFTTVAAVFGTGDDAPFTLAPPCTLHHDGQLPHSCTCDRAPWIRCPTCGRRCDVELPAC